MPSPRKTNSPVPSAQTPNVRDDGTVKLAQQDSDVEVSAPLIGDYLADSELDVASPDPIDPELPTNPSIIVTDDNEVPEGWQSAPSTLDLDEEFHATPPHGHPPSAHVPDIPTSSYSAQINQKAHEQNRLYENWLPPQSALPPLRKVRYEGRVRVIEAWKFNGVITEAPGYVDRNWLAYGGYDDVRKIQPGPMIQMPTSPRPGFIGQMKECRIGDYIVKQEIKLNNERPPEEKIEVWPADEFERVFISVPADDDQPELGLPAPKKGKAA